MLSFITVENVVIIVELAVISFLLWHTNELRKSSKELEKAIKEMDETHKAVHRDTTQLVAAMERLEQDIAK